MPPGRKRDLAQCPIRHSHMNENSLRQFRDVSAFWTEVQGDPVFRGANLITTGQHNRKVILQATRAEGETTCARLVGLTGLTTPAIFKITKDLVSDRLLTCLRGVANPLGKPGHVFRLNPDVAFALGLNIASDKITLVAVDFAGTVVRRFQRSVRRLTSDDVRVFVAEGIKCLALHDGGLISRVAGFGIAVSDGPGTMAFPDLPRRLRDWLGTSLPDLSRGIGDIPISLENDVTAAAIGEMLVGAGLGLNSLLLFVCWCRPWKPAHRQQAAYSWRACPQRGHRIFTANQSASLEPDGFGQNIK